ncbi:hypothetical protein RDWZM_006143 [Blomia tropicalis]|uniref:Chromodomain-helicase-DNA-binding protein 7 n=1 Tax=Blomia tropicalis TaxID=40697 RepID=A0A9Q0RP26_BLOTA|nr:hypothetical protein RDWZM_006143 [Blomia tropicalis]
MADYQLLGDTFGYHPGYPPNPSQQNAALGASQTGAGQPGLGMLPGTAAPGQQPYHSLQAPRPGYSQGDPLMSHKLHSAYPGYPGAGPPGSSPSLRSQYSQNYMPHSSMDSYSSLSMGQSHLAGATQSLGPAYGQHQNLMGQYPGQRMHAPSPLHATPRHPSMPSQYGSAYGSASSQPTSAYHSGGTGDLWSSGQSMSHLQQPPFSTFPQTATSSASSVSGGSVGGTSLHSSRSSQFSTGADYGSNASNPYFSNHLSTDSSYPPGYPTVSQPQSQSQQSTSSRSSSVSSSRGQQYSSQLTQYGSSTPSSTISAQNNQQQQQSGTNPASSSNSNSRFSHYSSYPQSMPFDPSAQARLSPYPTAAPTTGSQTPNSPQYRSSAGYPPSGSTSGSQMPVLSPRRPTATPPAGSPMPPTSHTPGPPSVGSNSTQSSTQGSAFSIATPSSGHHLSNSGSSATPSSLQQLEQMVMPHLGSGGGSSSNSSTTNNSKSLATSSSSASSTFFPSNASSSPISPQSQSQQSKLFPHFAGSSPSAQSSQYQPYHPYSQGQSGQWPSSSSGGPMSTSTSHPNTHPLKPGAMIPPSSLHGAPQQHLSSPSTNTSTKSHPTTDSSSLHQPYANTYGGGSSKSSNEPDGGDFSQPFSSTNSHQTSSVSPSASIPVSHTLPQGSYSNNHTNSSMSSGPGLGSYDTLSNSKQQSSLKNDTQHFDSKNSRSGHESLTGELNPMTVPSSQMTSLNSNSYHSMMQQPYSSQPLSAYPSQSRFDHPMSSQYGMSTEMTNSSYDHDSSMMYDPYNIDNSLGIGPPHQSMSEYREAQANLQQSGADFAQTDPYAANFDDYETTSKRKGKGRPKKEASTAPKKERKPRAPRPPSTRGTGRGRGRGAKNAAERLPIPGMMPEFGDPSSQYGVPPLGHPTNDSLDMYGNNVDMYSGQMGANKISVGSANQMSVEPNMMNSVTNNLNSSVLSQQPPSSDMIPSYGPPPTQPSVPMIPSGPNQLHNSLPQSMAPPQSTPVSALSPPFEPMVVNPPIADTSYTNFTTIDSMATSVEPPTSLQPSNVSICDKDLSNENKNITVPPPFSMVDDRFLSGPTQPSNIMATTNTTNNSNIDTTNHVPVKTDSPIVPNQMPTNTVPSVSDDVVTTDVDKMSFNSTMDTSCAPLGPQSGQHQPQPQQQQQQQPPPTPMQPLVTDSIAPYTTSSISKPISDTPMMESNELIDKSNSTNYDINLNIPVVPSQTPHIGGPMLPMSTMGNVPEFHNSYGYPEDPNQIPPMHGFVASTPIVEGKTKKPKKRKSKKGEQTIDDDSAIKDDSPLVEKPKKKRTKKPKVVIEEPSISMDNSAMFSSIDMDDKTQLSCTLDASSTIMSETETPKAKPKSKKKPKRSVKSETVESESIVGDESVDLNGIETSIEIAEEKPKKPKLKNKSPKKKMPKLALKLKQNKKKRRGFGSPDNSDLEKTPPPSPLPDDESAIHKRRSARNTKRQRYNDDIDLELSDDSSKNKDDSQVVNVQLTEDTMVVEKILSTRMAKRELELEPNEQKEGENGVDQPVFVDVEEFYVKYKNLSYLHCDWKTEDELEKGDRRISQKIKRYRQKKDVNVFDFLDEEPFNPDYVEVDRVLDVNEIEEVIIEEEEEQIPPPPPPTIKAESITTDNVESKNETKSEQIDELKSDSINDDQTNLKPETDEKDIIEKIDDNVEEKTDKENINGTDTDNDKATLDDSNKTESNNETKIEEENIEPKTEEKVESKKELDSTDIEKPKKTRIVRHFLVKWRGLSYEESTWELEDDIDPAKIQQFWKFRDPPPKSEWKIKKRPKAAEWKKLSQSRLYKNGNSLREYQLEGVNWLNFCWHNGQNCILADEMGLGKTIQSITFVQEMVSYGIPYPYLIIVPLSTIGNWQREFETWTDLNVVTYHGSSPSRNMLQEYELYYKNEKNERIPNVYKFQVMITTFEVILTDCVELSTFKWVACIIDEAHRLKNRNCKLLEGLRMLNIDHRVLLTGTPLQNNVEELFSLLNFLEPSQFTSNENFLAEFGDLKTEAQVDKLKAILKPMMLRRLKEDVEKSLAPKEETIIEVELTNVQKKYYRAILERNFQFLSKGGTYANMPNLMNTVMELRKCCIHPFLINGAEEQILHEFRQQQHEEATLNAIIQSSGKLVLIDKLLPRLKENGHRVLIFSQMVRCLDILEDYLCQKRYPYERIDGRVRGNLRQAAIDRYSKPDSDRFVFLLCTRAGGLGINLTAADTVIIFDSDWNPQNDLQAQARCHRIGQKKSVKVYRLICRNTYEREMFDRASLKLGLDKAVLQSINAQKAAIDGQMSKKEIEDLLRKGAYGALMDDDNAGDKFCEEDIDMILQRRTTKIVIESEGKGGSFSKASFATSDNRTDIEIDDPNFWEKWAKKANFDIDELKNRNELIVQEPRRRTQTKRFGADDAVMEISDLDTSTDEEEAISMRTRGSRNRPLKKRRKGRNYDPEHDEDYAQEIGFGWNRSEFFRVEKGLLTYGWDRWDECLRMANFKRALAEHDVEDISRIILLFALQNYKGDEKVKAFILDLITPPSERNTNPEMEGLKALIEQPFVDDGKCPMGSRCKKNKLPVKSVGEELETLDWAKNEKYNPEIHLTEDYRKHLLRHANKILLRVRLLAYIKNDIIGDLHDKVFSLAHVREIPIPYSQPDTDPPTTWWDEEADKSLLIGVYKHGYDRYNLMRHDQSLCFFSRCGPPDGAALLAELSSECDDGKTLDEDEPIHRQLLLHHWLKLTKEEARIAQKARHQQRIERIEKFEAVMRAKELKKREQAQKKWSRREESDFYRVVSSYGIEYNRATDAFDWGRFRMFAKLDRKMDDTLTEYFRAFYAMCKKVVGRQLTEEDENLPISVDPITEEKANRVLARIDLLSKVREEIYNPELDEKLKICQPQLDLPDWWICGKHDKDLLFGAAKYGLTRLDYNLMNDPDLSFIEIVRNYESQINAQEEKKPVVDAIETEVKSLLNSMLDQVVNMIPLSNETTDEEKVTEGDATKEPINVKNEVDDSDIDMKSKDSIKEETKTSSESEGASDNKDNIKKESVVENEENKPSVNESLNESKDANHRPTEIDHTCNQAPVQPKVQLKWPRDRVLQIRLENICLALEKNEWPTFRGMNALCMPHSTTPSVATADSSPRPSTPCSLSSASQEATPHPTPDHTPRRESQSPFTGGEYYYSNNASQSINTNMINYENESNRRRRRRRKRFEMENDRNNKLHSLLNVQFEQPSVSHKQSNSGNHNSANINLNSNNSGLGNTNNNNNTNNNANSNKMQSPLSNAALSSLASQLFKNSKGQPNSLLNNIPSQFLTPLLGSLPFNLRSLRDDIFSDEKTSLLLSNSLAAAAAASAKSNISTSKSSNADSKNNLQSGPPPAHQSSSTRNALPLGTLDLTSKFKNASSSAAMEKPATQSSRSNQPYPAHKPMKNMGLEKADVLDLSAVNSKHDPKSAMSNLLSQSLQKSMDMKTSAFLAQANNFPNLSGSGGSGKKKQNKRLGIDALALNLQAKKIMEEVKQVDPVPSTTSKSQPKAPKTFNEKELLAALSNLGEKRTGNMFEEFSKHPSLQSMKGKVASSLSGWNASNVSSMMKKPNDPKSQMSLFESLKLFSGKSNKDSANLLQKNMKTLLEEHPELLASSSSLSSLLSSQMLGQASGLGSLGSTGNVSNPTNIDEKMKSTRSKRTRSQFETQGGTSTEEPLSKRQMMNMASKNPYGIDPKNPNFKYLSSLLDGKTDVEAKIKNFINLEKSGSFKTPVSNVPSNTSSSIRTRTSDKRQSSSTSSSSSSSNFANLNASNLLNNLSLAAAAASTGGGSASSKQQQQTAASLLNYANAFNTASSKSGSSNFSNTASQFSNFGFNPSMIANNFPSMKMFLDAAAAAAAAASSVSKSSSSSSNTTSTTSSSNTSSNTTSTTTSSTLSSFANLLGGMNNMTNPLLNFSNFANLGALSQSGNKKDGSSSGVDLAALFASNLSSASNIGNDDKSKGNKSSSSSSMTNTSSSSSKNKTGLNPSAAAAAAAAASMLGSSGLGSSALPFLYSNPNFSMSGLNALYNPLNLGNFGLTSPFLNNPNLMNGLGNFSNVFTSTTPTISSTSTSSNSSKTKTTNNKSSTKVTPSKSSTGSSSTAPSGLSLASGMLSSSATTAGTGNNPSTSAIDSDDESLKSLMGHDDEDDLNGEFESSEPVQESKGRKSKSSSSSHKQHSSTPVKEGKSKRSTTSK